MSQDPAWPPVLADHETSVYRPHRRRWVPKGLILLAILFVTGLVMADPAASAWPTELVPPPLRGGG